MIRSIALIASLFVALPAHANERPTSERVWDGIGFGASVTLGGAVGALAVGALSYATCDETDDGGFFSGCELDAAIGAIVGSLPGFVLGGLAYDGFSDGDGSLWGAAGGATVGLLAGLGTIYLFDGQFPTDHDVAIGFGMTLVGASVGYGLFDATSVTPTASIVPDGTGGRRSTFGLVGRF